MLNTHNVSGRLLLFALPQASLFAGIAGSNQSAFSRQGDRHSMPQLHRTGFVKERRRANERRQAKKAHASPCLGWRVVNPCAASSEFSISHYITSSTTSVGTCGGRRLPTLSTRRESVAPPATPPRFGWPVSARQNHTSRGAAAPSLDQQAFRQLASLGGGQPHRRLAQRKRPAELYPVRGRLA